MQRERRMAWGVLLGAVLCASAAHADGEVGKVSVLEGKAHRTSAAGEKVDLAVGSAVVLGDSVAVDARSNLKLTLNDQSELCLGESSELKIDEAEFAGQERKSFSARLLLGKVWAHVSKALSGSQSKFEVKAARAVAGVRGTIFRVDALPLVTKTYPPPIRRTVVRVTEGRVAVDAEVKKASGGGSSKDTGPRHQVPGPSQVSSEEWEKHFAELQKNQQVTIGESSFEQGTFDPAQKDAFERFVDKARKP